MSLAVALACAGPPAARAAAVTNDGCMMCHKDPALARSVGRTGTLFVDQAGLARSAHGRLACNDCHVDATSLSHPAHLAPVRCVTCHREAREKLANGVHRGISPAGVDASCTSCHGIHDVAAARRGSTALCQRCHQREFADYQSSVHGVAIRNGDTDASSCNDCHGSPHELKPHTDPASPVSLERVAGTCARCHANRELMIRRRITIPEAVELFRNSVHGRSKKPGAATCIDCHEAHRLRRAADPQSSIYRSNIPATCGRCHRQEAAAYESGIHGSSVRRGITAAPVCTDCHGEHLIRGPGDPDSPAAAAHVVETCSRCHEAAGIRQTYGLPGGRLETYRDSYHGLAARGGSPVVANCASCHGYHEILPSSDPRSKIAPRNLAATCGKCHPGAGPQFAMGKVHVAMATTTQPALYWTRIVYLLLIAGTIGFMLLHNLLDFARKIAHSLQVHTGRLQPHARAVERWFVRMTVAERLQHALLALSFFTLVYTGFALKYPEVVLFRWLTHLEGGYAWRSLIHRAAAVVMVATSLFHACYLLSRRGRRLVLDLFPRLDDALGLLQNLLYLCGLRRTPARFDRFGYIEKAEYWALIWGTFVMTATGLVLWFENDALRTLPKWALDLATMIHYYEAWLAFLAIVVWHLYQNIVNPDVYPMNWTWLTGRISEEQLRHEHHREWERIVNAEAAEREAAGEALQAAGRVVAAPPPPDPAAASARRIVTGREDVPPTAGAQPADG